jgi:hypothetical protein
MVKEKLNVTVPNSSSLNGHSKELGNQGHLTSHIFFVHPLHLPFPDHIHHLETLSCSPGCQMREKAHSRLRQPFHEAVILLNEIMKILDLSQLAVFGNMSFCL